MKLALAQTADGAAAGLVDEDSIRLSSLPGGIFALLSEHGTDFAAMRTALLSSAGDPVDLNSVRLLAPLPRPGKILGIGRNYGAHARETGSAPQEKPRIFMKPATAISGPGDIVRRPSPVRKMDYEGELVAIIGTRIHDVDAEQAVGAIAGFTMGNDLSAREFQFDVNPPQTSFAKGMDGFAPIGPFFVTADELGPAPDLLLQTHVNGEKRQSARTSELIFPVSECISHISRYMVLEPGDLIFTGTPSGVGCFMDPPQFLQPGDEIAVSIEKIGTLHTRIA